MARLEHIPALSVRSRDAFRGVYLDSRVIVSTNTDERLTFAVQGDMSTAAPAGHSALPHHTDGLFVNLKFDSTGLSEARVLVYANPSPVVTQRFNRLFQGLGAALTWYHRTNRVMFHGTSLWVDVPVEVVYEPVKAVGGLVQWRALYPAAAPGPWSVVGAKRPASPRKAPAAPRTPVAPPVASIPVPTPVAAPAPSVAVRHGDPAGLFKFPVLTKKSEVTLKVETIARLDAMWASHLAGARECLALVGPTGTAKTSLANNLAARFDVGIFTFDAVGAREFSDWVGTTHLRGDRTEFVPSGFLRAIDADGEYAGIHRFVLIDEVTRAESSGSLNALVPVLHDFASVYIPELGRAVSVDPAVMFILTANVGAEYSGTINLDIALSDRVTGWVKMHNLEEGPETALLLERNPGLTREQAARLVLAATDIRRAAGRGDLPDGGGISTRRLLVAGWRVSRGMSLKDAAEMTWLDSYHNEAEAAIVKSAIDGTLRTNP